MDVRRPDLAIPYVHRPDVAKDLPSSVMFRTLPMVAMFLRSKVLAWAGLFLCVQAYLSQPADSSANEDALTLGHIATGVMGVAISYMDFVFAPGRAPST